MKDAFERMPPEFLDWLAECPLSDPWVRIKTTDKVVHYSFPAPDEEDET
tara:strand:- start:1395 stop:1541 length:147 start_codon:yes stop_codon:yes gene_type:complete